ncbi:hypothetical protein MMC19_002227 [Ptychographa xylographoides]|nr:hypothetical protein [Ptychographa xylographoides]
MASLFDLTRNFSLYTVPAAWILSLAPHVYATQLYDAKSAKSFDLTQPRSLTAKVANDQTLDQATKDRVIRAEGAQQNGFENVGLFAAAVVAGNVAGVDHWWLNTLSGGYVASRVVYNFVYINNESVAVANARTGVFLSGIGMIFGLFIMAGNRLRNTPFSK